MVRVLLSAGSTTFFCPLVRSFFNILHHEIVAPPHPPRRVIDCTHCVIQELNNIPIEIVVVNSWIGQ